MAFFSSPSMPKLPFPGEPSGSKTGWASGDSHPVSSGSTSVYGGTATP